MIQRIKTYLKDRPYLELFKIGSPIILGQVGIIFVSFADSIMVGRYHTDHFASAAFVNNLYALVYVLGIGFAYGLTPLVTEAHTQGKRYTTGALLRHSLVLNLALALVLSLVMGGLYFYLDVFDLSEHLMPIVRPYYLLQLVCFFLYMAFNAFKQFFDGIERTSIGMWTILGGNALNILGNVLLIYGVGRLPELGLFGAGLSTLFSRIIMLLILLLVFFLSSQHRVAVKGFCSQIYSWIRIKRLIRVGLPVGLYSGVETASFTVALIFVSRLGHIALAVHQILCVVTTLGFFIYYGWGAASTILVSRYKALGDLLKARQAASVALQYSILAALLAMGIMIVFRHQIAYIFTEDEAILSMVAIPLIPVILYQIGDAIQVVYANALRGMEDVTYLAVAACLIHLLLEPMLSYIFGFHLGLVEADWRLMAIWSCFPIGLLLLGILLRRRFRKVTEPSSVAD